LTGTPIENNLVDLYSIFRFLNPDLFKTYSMFEKEHIIYIMKKMKTFRKIRGKFERRDVEFKHIVGYKNVPELKKKIAPFYVRRTDEDTDDVELPQMVSENFIIPMHEKQLKMYKDLKKKVLDSDHKSLDTSRIKLLRLCDHSAMIDPETNYSNKIEALMNLIHDNFHRKIIVFSQWADMIKLIHQSLNGISHSVVVGTGSKSKFDFKINDQEQFDKFKGMTNILIATDAISRSQDFPHASVVINVDLPWNPATIRQRIMRIRRLSSQHKTVFTFNLVSEGTIEETVLPVLEAKMQLAKDVIDDNEFIEDHSFDLLKMLGRK
jgi:SNF2 family DNA or RNA helicase